MGKKKKKKSHLASNIVLAVSIGVFVVAAFQLFRIGKGYQDGRKDYKELRDTATEKKKSKKDGEEKFIVDFAKLAEINPDVIGWIRFDPEPSVINYPIVQGKDNQEYLHKTFSKNENGLGAIFLNVDNDSNFNDKHSVIYGHRMKDGSMFRHLQDYEEMSFWKKNPHFYIYMPNGRVVTYRIYSVGEVLDMSEAYETDFPDGKAYQEFIDQTKKNALYETGVKVRTADKVVTLSTCTQSSDNHRFVVHGVKETEEVIEIEEETKTEDKKGTKDKKEKEK